MIGGSWGGATYHRGMSPELFATGANGLKYLARLKVVRNANFERVLLAGRHSLDLFG